MVHDKVTDPKIFTDIGSNNPMPKIMTNLRAHWVEGVNKQFIPLNHAFETVGITEYRKQADQALWTFLNLERLFSMFTLKYIS